MFVGPESDQLAHIEVNSGSGGLKTTLRWQGCAESAIGELGAEPNGSIQIDAIATPEQVKPSSDFELIIYKDEARTQTIAKLAPGTILSASVLQPG